MLLIRYDLKEDTQSKYQDGEYISNAGNPAANATKVVASGKWLDRIRKHFKHLPDFETGAYPTTVAWYGDHAKFIAGNIADVCSVYWELWLSSEGQDGTSL